MIESCKSAEEVVELSRKGQDAFNKLEHSPKPVVAAIMGPCLGGGLEVRRGGWRGGSIGGALNSRSKDPGFKPQNCENVSESKMLC